MIQVPERPERLLTSARIVVDEMFTGQLWMRIDGQNNGRELFWVANVPSALFQYFLSKAIDNDNEYVGQVV
jgi:hypothetical protein